MNRLRKTALALVAVIALVGSSFAGQVTVGGNIPLINSIIGIGVLSLDFGSSGDDVTIATFIVNNNSPGYSITWQFENKGAFSNGTSEITIEEILLSDGNNTGTLGTGCNELPADNLGITTETDSYTWNAAVKGDTEQTSATINYQIEMTADWANSAEAMAGLYTETITYTITAEL
ncbi:MAG: hypothetical protein GXY77_05440 [Fibrobacter sp.]|nr:hypothetical protein [Fibrobacter sp.]